MESLSELFALIQKSDPANDGDKGTQRVIIIIDLNNDLYSGQNRVIRKFFVHSVLKELYEGEVLGIGISPDGTKLLTVLFDGPVELWGLNSSDKPAGLGGNGGYISFSINETNLVKLSTFFGGISAPRNLKAS
jgi:hypothetical protein